MKLKLISFATLILFTGQIISQKYANNHIIYGITNNLDFSRPSNKKQSDSSSDLLKKSAQLSEQLEFEMYFNDTQSVFSSKKQLDNELNGVQEKMAKKLVGDATYYYDYKSKDLLVSKQFIGDLFLISHPIENYDWTITKQSKKILGFDCKKAFLVMKADKIRTKNQKIIAWFAPSISTQFGPKIYYGLPGHILELTEGKFTYYAKKLNLNIKSRVLLEKPNKGNKITKTKYHDYIIQKSKEYGFIK